LGFKIYHLVTLLVTTGSTQKKLDKLTGGKIKEVDKLTQSVSRKTRTRDHDMNKNKKKRVTLLRIFTS
jgi:hypothetical protein